VTSSWFFLSILLHVNDMNKAMNISLITTYIPFCTDITDTQWDITSVIYHQPVQKYKKGGNVDIYWDADEVLALFRPQCKCAWPICVIQEVSIPLI